MREFNTSGPNIPERHYTIERRPQIAEGLRMVEQERYFTIWAPRQTGKSTYFRQLAVHLKPKGYRAMHINLESFKTSTFKALMDYFRYEAHRQWRLELPDFETMEQWFNWFNALQTERLVLIIDEIEGLNPELFNQFLHAIRNLYHSRQDHSLKSVILVGVTNILGVVSDNASPFNIADNLDLPYFTREEVSELLGQHEVETGQLFDAAVKEKIYQITAGQPGLVNGFAYQLVRRYANVS
ncbi:MAG: AAA-like domain-containing protein, partial [Saprospiraceae bacterium]|nr:AAA-like domain-containing protein [Saprospiraceae bacterium]